MNNIDEYRSWNLHYEKPNNRADKPIDQYLFN